MRLRDVGDGRGGGVRLDDPVFKPRTLRQMLQILGAAALITFPLGALSGGALVKHFGADACEPCELCTAERATVAGPHGNAAQLIQAQAAMIQHLKGRRE